MTPFRPSVSVIIPVYNGETFVDEAIDSVIHQKYEPLEIIIVDDGSTDRTAEVIRGYGEKVQYRYQSNTGPAAARNSGLRVASGDVMAFIDADDLWPEGKLALQINRLQQEPTLEVVLGRVQYSMLSQTAGSDATFVPFTLHPLPPISGPDL